MIEFILIVGLLYVLGITIILHIMSTSENFNKSLPVSYRSQIDPGFHPWFMSVETVLILSITYIGSRWFI